jgi:ribosomal protein S27AE
MATTQAVPTSKGEQIYLLFTQTRDKNFIKIGCTGDLRARMKAYDTHNPTMEKAGSFKMPNRECGRCFEDALLLRLHEKRFKKTEWYEVDDATFEEFWKISTLDDVKRFVELDEYFSTMIEINLARANTEEKPQRAKAYMTKAILLRDTKEMIG